VKHLLTPTSIGEVLDKISILQIKSERIKDKNKLENIFRELGLLTILCSNQGLEFNVPLFDSLKKVNEELWEIEDAIRLKEKAQAFDGEFIALARSVYLTNDRRARIKGELNVLFKSDLMEEKSYEDYTAKK
jgi:Family of unknown function (DUF6165)